MNFRNATLDDLPAIVAIYNATIPSRMVTADTEPVTLASRERWFHDHTPDRRPLWVAEENDRIAGWLSFSSFYGRPAYDRTCEVSIYVAEACRGRGLGGDLLKRCIHHAHNLEVATLIGFIFAHNAPSLRLFTRFGFERWGYLPRIAVLDDLERDVVIVGRRVDPADIASPVTRLVCC